MNILDEAERLTADDRQKIYGHPAVNYAKLAGVWSALTGVQFNAVEVQQMLIALKLVRATNSPEHLDTLVDIAGYARTIQMTIEGENNENEYKTQDFSSRRNNRGGYRGRALNADGERYRLKTDE